MPKASPAGDFTAWLGMIRSSISNGSESDVPCGSCTACCTSSQFVHIEPDEIDALSHIPKSLLFPAPGLPAGNVLLGYDERGHCPMLLAGACSIYAHRPRTCRAYDCRVFAASGIEPDQPAIAEKVRTWAFSYADQAGVSTHAAVQASAGMTEPGGPALRRALQAVVAST